MPTIYDPGPGYKLGYIGKGTRAHVFGRKAVVSVCFRGPIAEQIDWDVNIDDVCRKCLDYMERLEGRE